MSWHSAGRLGWKGKGDDDIQITTKSLQGYKMTLFYCSCDSNVEIIDLGVPTEVRNM